MQSTLWKFPSRSWICRYIHIKFKHSLYIAYISSVILVIFARKHGFFCSSDTCRQNLIVDIFVFVTVYTNCILLNRPTDSPVYFQIIMPFYNSLVISTINSGPTTVQQGYFCGVLLRLPFYKDLNNLHRNFAFELEYHSAKIHHNLFVHDIWHI